MISHIINQVWKEKVAFLSVFFVVFLLSYIFLVAIDFVPEPIETDENQPATSVTVEKAIEKADLKEALPVGRFEEPVTPTSIYIEKLDKTVPVLNPLDSDIASLDKALLSGVVRHPDSALLGADGNVFIMGHSSYLPTVLNKNFQAFNGIQNLEWGDTIEVRSGNNTVVYRVDKVFKTKTSDLVVPLVDTGPRLTLATCNNFGSQDDRFIVEAVPVDNRQI